MNKAKARQLQNYLKDKHDRFNMAEDVVHTCRSAVCIAGHAAILWPEIRYFCLRAPKDFLPDYDKLADILDIPNGVRSRLTHPSDLENRTLLQALGALDSLIESDGKEVVWPESDAESGWQWS